MRTVDELGRAAGAELRAWEPGVVSVAPPREILRRAVQRRRRQRVSLGAAALALAVGGAVWFPSLGDDSGVETGPSATPSSETPVVPGPTPTPPAPAPTPTPTPSPSPSPSAEVACTASFPYDPTVVYDVVLPAGWSANAAEVVPGRGGGTAQRDACTGFGPDPAADAVALSVRVEGRQGQTFDEMVASMSEAPTTVSTQSTTVDGHRAARFEVVIPEDDLAYVHWQVDVGDRWLSLSTISDDEQATAGLDAIVASLRIRTVG